MSRWLTIAVWSFASFVFVASGFADDSAPAASPAVASEAPTSETKASADASGHDDHGGHDAHGHDQHDLSHANPSSELYSPAEFRLQSAVGAAVVFGVLLLLLGKFAWGPIAAGLDAREKSIADMIAEAKRNQEETAVQLKLYEGKMQRAADEARERINVAEREADVRRAKIVAEAEAEAARKKDEALAEIRAAKNAALSEIANKTVNTAISLAGNIIRREVRAEDHDAMIQDSLTQFRKN